MKTIYQNAWNNSFTYNDYLKLVDDKIEQKLSTGHEQNELLTDFTKLNRVRMKRLDKTQQLLPEVIEAVKKIGEKQLWLVLTESWCGDAAQNIPVLKKIADENPLIDFRLVLRDDNDELMQKYLTNGGRSIPKLIAISEDMEKELFTWGPRPAAAQTEVKRLLDEQGGFNDIVKEGVQLWYNNDKGISMQKEMMELL
ncbi:MAG TPA: thioredoxin family protein [Flavobacterium sp.]|nr:thioredoxin family protein [Flavobacterium sp.]